ncbi:hypothetical protein JCM9492_09850 [Aquifex pyrophilus]
MKKFLVAFALGVGFSFSHMHGGMGSQMMMQGSMGMQDHMMYMMMQDPEVRRIMREHMMKCRRELMEKLAKLRAEKFANMMLQMIEMHPEAFKKALKENPELRKKMKELLEEGK